ncbi:FecCD family ABC transporter permease [Clostridium intestinale]|uniref:Iron ABC transporter permease n=1 Tax=Clostridium intestinale TaxID=36845 RepID=A0A7D6VMM9_9CLOT|nr:iron ABC transporter permease [Clostridium intestinale]QLY78247.1 iron ABC transporter permease [Clostridium intestinale]
MAKNRPIPIIILLLSPIVIILAIVLSVIYGAKDININIIRDAFLNFDGENVNHQIIMYSRIPRVIGALLIGAFLAISGALMQGMTRNYLASPSIMGVSDGSVFAITICMIFFPDTSSLNMIFYSFIGSAIGAGLVFGLASLTPNGMSPVRLAIIGTITGSFLSSISAALSTYFQVSQNISFWYNAKLHQITPDKIKIIIPFAIIGIITSLIISKSITILSLGEEISISLGQNTKLIKIVAMGTVVILTGISVALAGKIAFVGLIIPHIVRFFVGSDYRWIVPCSGVMGAILLAFSDIISRFINYPFETPIGVVTSFIGVPFFLYLARTKGGKK